MKIPAILGSLVILALSGNPVHAFTPVATYYDFSFSIEISDSTYPYTPTGEFITGKIIGLQDNATTTPYDIIITNDPFNPAVAESGNNYSLKSNFYIDSPYVADTMEVTNGMITGMGAATESLGSGLSWFKVYDPDPYAQIEYNFAFYGDSNGEGSTNDPTFHGNPFGFPSEGLVFEPGTLSGIPEPSQWGEGICIAFAAVMLIRRRRISIPFN